ncbi:response regulator [Beijerinckia indica]|uniref:Response regulator receiver protein n=1 Tax=Beijerinckia indica subsp. indica (strain ATCC 9039 / DSM 1715 / NCIMB 8712) TaxID=395963 RepID=B2IGH6_BEII9|nr:response regulator [Beijerinckia indica]ACB94358.1 response regulator receiver protein [Beijerinckia indica subsp. indica ATCC 9039]
MIVSKLTGRRVLVVEDEILIAVMIEEVLLDLGCIVVGPIGKLEAAMQLARDEALDMAILDVSIRGGYVYPVAERLLARDIPIILASGYGGWALPENLRDQPRLTKPFTTQELESQIRACCRQV